MRRLARLPVASAVAIPAIAVLLAVAPPVAAQVPLRAQTDAPCGAGTTLSGHVVEARSRLPLPSALVRAAALGADGDSVVRRARTREDGLFQFCGLEDGTELRLSPTWDGNSGRARSVTSGSGGELVVLEIDLGEPTFLALTIRDATTLEPVPGVSVLLEPLDLGGISDEQGRLATREVPPGEYTVRAHHLAYAAFADRVVVEEHGAEEFEILMRPAAIALEPLEVRITGRDPILVGQGFYDRLATLEEGEFFDYWDVEPYALLSTFVAQDGFIPCPIDGCVYFINGRIWEKSVYGMNTDSENTSNLDLPSFGKIRGVERIRCADLPPRMMNQLETLTLSCWAYLVWEGFRRVRSERDPPADGMTLMEREGRVEKKPDGGN